MYLVILSKPFKIKELLLKSGDSYIAGLQDQTLRQMPFDIRMRNKTQNLQPKTLTAIFP